MKFIFAFIILANLAWSAERIVGNGNDYKFGKSPESSYRFELDFDRNGKPARSLAPESSIGAIQAIGEIKISFDDPEFNIWQTFPFYITQLGDNDQYSLIGFYIDHGYPNILQIDTWSKEREFTLFELFRSKEKVLNGTFCMQTRDVEPVAGGDAARCARVAPQL